MTAWLCLLAVALCDDPAMVPLLATLPEDGRWAKYNLRVQAANEDQTMTWTVRSVGQFQQGGRDVRCIETEIAEGNGNIPPAVHRMLVPLDAFGPDKHALGQTVRMWKREGTNAVESFDSIQGDPITAMFLAGATEDVRKREQKETVDWQRGKLACDVFTGKSTQMIGDGKFHMTWTILRHQDVPFGLAGLRMRITVENQPASIEVTLTLQDYGTDAKAALPDFTP